MPTQYLLNSETQEYLNSFHCILNEMIQRMTSAELTDSISHNFIVQMIPHHMAAIEMSRNILKYTEDATLRSIASNIVSSQTKSITNLQKVLPACSILCNTREDLCCYQCRTNRIMQIMFANMKEAKATNRTSCDFMWEMIPHHAGAVEMSRNALQYHICPGLKPILHSIITSQQEGIMQMQQLLCHIGC